MSLHRKLHTTLLVKGNRVGSLKDKLVELMSTSFLGLRNLHQHSLRRSDHPTFVRWLKNKTAIILNVSSLSERNGKRNLHLHWLSPGCLESVSPHFTAKLGPESTNGDRYQPPPPTSTRAAQDGCGRCSLHVSASSFTLVSCRPASQIHLAALMCKFLYG